jgi:hypothetical protein
MLVKCVDTIRWRSGVKLPNQVLYLGVLPVVVLPRALQSCHVMSDHDGARWQKGHCVRSSITRPSEGSRGSSSHSSLFSWRTTREASEGSLLAQRVALVCYHKSIGERNLLALRVACTRNHEGTGDSCSVSFSNGIYRDRGRRCAGRTDVVEQIIRLEVVFSVARIGEIICLRN